MHDVPGERAPTEDAFLGGALSILQPATGYRAGIDAVLLAAAAPVPAGQASRVLDMGAGVGTVGLAVARRIGLPVKVVLLERQPALAALARENITRNALSGSVRLVEGDIAAEAAVLTEAGIAADSFDHVLANPPYHRDGDGTPARDPVKAAANAMPAEALEVWVRVMARLVAPGGSATVIHKTEALPELLAAMARRFGRLRILPILPRADEPAVRIIVQGRKASRAPLALLPPLVLHGEGQEFTPAVADILRHGAALPLA